MFGLKRLVKGNDQEKINKNIEVINNNLYALRFGLIPFIKEIEYTPYEEIPQYEEPIRIDKANGVIILNKDHKGYELIKDAMIMAMNKKNIQLENNLLNLKRLKNKNNLQIILESAYTIELERRMCVEMERGKPKSREGVTWPQ